MNTCRTLCVLLAGLLVGVSGHVSAQVTGDAPSLTKPEAIVNLATGEGTKLVEGQWKFSNVSIIDVDHRAVGHDLKASGPPTRTHDITPKAGGADFDDSQWETIDPSTLDARRSDGRLVFVWYRIAVTIPRSVGTFDPTGSTVIFEIVVDDYAEVWVNGQLPLVLGQAGGQLVKGFNAPNRVVLTRDAKPGQKFQLAVFAMNGPISDPPANFIWIRSATLDFYRPNQVGSAESVMTTIVKNDPSLDEIVSPDGKIEKLAGGFQFTEGPVWIPEGKYLLFSDPNNNTIYRWSPEGRSLCSVPRADMPELISAGTTRRVPTDLLSIPREGLASISTGTGEWCDWKRTAS